MNQIRDKFKGPETKDCAQCGKTFHRDKRCTWKWWDKARFCSRHCSGKFGQQKRSDELPPLEARFMAKVSKQGDCWMWTGIEDKDGYGLLPHDGRPRRANRLSLEFFGPGPAPKPGMYACHTCDTPGCVNPDHLYWGTPTQNFRDMKIRGRAVLGSMRRNSKLTESVIPLIRSDTRSNKAIADDYGVCRASIENIKKGKTWKHV